MFWDPNPPTGPPTAHRRLQAPPQGPWHPPPPLITRPASTGRLPLDLPAAAAAARGASPAKPEEWLRAGGLRLTWRFEVFWSFVSSR